MQPREEEGETAAALMTGRGKMKCATGDTQQESQFEKRHQTSLTVSVQILCAMLQSPHQFTQGGDVIPWHGARAAKLTLAKTLRLPVPLPVSLPFPWHRDRS